MDVRSEAKTVVGQLRRAIGIAEAVATLLAPRAVDAIKRAVDRRKRTGRVEAGGPT